MIQYKYLKLALIMTLGGMTLLANQVLSLPNDREQNVDFSADEFEMEFNDKTETITYYGSVVMEQGSMRINADKLVIYQVDGKVVEVIATGSPAHYKQVPAINQEPVLAKANRLEYQVEQETLHLIDDASLVQEGTSLSGNRIEYDVRNSIVKASSNSTSGTKRRVRMVIPPKSLSNQE